MSLADHQGTVYARSPLDPDDVEALAVFLRTPDPDDCWRSHRLTVEGKPDRIRLWYLLRAGYPVRQIAARESQV